MNDATTLLRSNRSAPAANELWATYWNDRSADARNALILHYLPVVRYAALRLLTRRGGQVELEDLIQYGTFGLKDAIAGFDRTRGVKFETYCSTRVRGAMLDGLKTLQWVPRDLRRTLTQFSETQQQIAMEAGAPAADEELASRLGVCPQAIRGLERDASRMGMTSLFTPSEGNEGSEHCNADQLEDHREESPAHLAQREDVKALFLRELSRPERLIMILYYYEEMTMREIGDTLGISGTRVSQMHSEIIQRLRERLEKRITEPTGRQRMSLDF